MSLFYLLILSLSVLIFQYKIYSSLFPFRHKKLHASFFLQVFVKVGTSTYYIQFQNYNYYEKL